MTVEEVTDYETHEVVTERYICDSCGSEIPEDEPSSTVVINPHVDFDTRMVSDLEAIIDNSTISRLGDTDSEVLDEISERQLQ